MNLLSQHNKKSPQEEKYRKGELKKARAFLKRLDIYWNDIYKKQHTLPLDELNKTRKKVKERYEQIKQYIHELST